MGRRRDPCGKYKVKTWVSCGEFPAKLFVIKMASSSRRSSISNAKKMRFGAQDPQNVAKKASEAVVPWNDVAPMYFSKWIRVFARAHGTTEDIMMMAILPTVAGLLGASTTLKLTDTYKENINLMLVCVAPPFSGKSTATNHGGKIPHTNVEQLNKARLLVDNFTHAGLTEQIILNDGIAICIKDELYTDLKSIISEKSMGYLCRWYDGDSFYTTKGNNSAERLGVKATGFCLGGFIQVRSFMEELFPNLLTAEDGFIERMLVSVVRPEALTRAETEKFASDLNNEQYCTSQDLTEIYDTIYRDHNLGSPVEYTLTDEAKKLFDEYDQEICSKLNKKWAEGDFSNSEETSLQCSGPPLSYFYLRRSVFKLYGPLPKVIDKQSMGFAIALTKYFSGTMNTLSKLLHPEEESSRKTFQSIVLQSKGSVVLMRCVRNRMSTASRPSLEEAMGLLEDMKEEGLGHIVTTNKSRAFIKKTPDKVNKDALTEYGITIDEYKKMFLTTNMDLQPRIKSNLLMLSGVGKEVEEYEYANK